MTPFNAPSGASSSRIFEATIWEMTPPSWSAEPRPNSRCSHSDSGGTQPSSFSSMALSILVRSSRPLKTNGGVDVYNGLLDRTEIDKAMLEKELGWVPPESEWEHLLFGRGSADQLGGVIAQIVASKILLELAPEGALKGVIVRSYATVCEEDNDGAGPMYVMRNVLPGAKDRKSVV